MPHVIKQGSSEVRVLIFVGVFHFPSLFNLKGNGNIFAIKKLVFVQAPVLRRALCLV